MGGKLFTINCLGSMHFLIDPSTGSPIASCNALQLRFAAAAVSQVSVASELRN